MQKIQEFNQTNLTQLRKEMQELLGKFGLETNIEFQIGKMTYNPGAVSMKIEAKVTGGKTIKEARVDRELQLMADLLKLKFEANGKKLVGYNSRQYKYPFIYEMGGKRYKTSEENAIRIFAA